MRLRIPFDDGAYLLGGKYLCGFLIFRYALFVSAAMKGVDDPAQRTTDRLEC